MFFEGYTEKLWGRHPSEISADWGAQRVKGLSILAVLKDMASKIVPNKNRKVETSLIEEFVYPKFGPGQLWELVGEEFEKMGGKILYNHKVTQINTDGGTVTGVVCECDGGEKLFEGDIFFSSMPVKDLVAGMGSVVPTAPAEIAKGLPYRDFVTVGLLLNKLNLKNETGIKTLGNIVPDCWIYVQDTGVKLGRIQIFNNWSPYLVKDPVNTVWVGLEYFCNEGDGFWNMSEEECVAKAVSELKSMGVIDSDAEILDSHCEKVQKAYPAYFDTYDRIGELVEYLDTFGNLYCVGRNGQHRYNNMDHSMATSFEAVSNVLSGKKTKENIWNVNTEAEYHEESKDEKRLDALLPLIIITISVIAELFLGNFVYFSCVAGRNGTVDLRPTVQTHTVTPEVNQIYFGSLDLELNSVELTLHNTDGYAFQDSVKVGIYTLDSEESDGLSFVTARQIPFSSADSTETLYCNPNGKTYGILLTFDDFEGEIEVTELTVNPVYTLRFDAMRFGFLLLIGTAVYIYKSRPEKPTLSYKSRHRRSLAAGVGACLGCTLSVIILNSMGEEFELIEYPLTRGVEAYDPFIQQFDAFMKGQLHLDVIPEEGLLLLDNPYDPSAREGIYYLWDRAFFEGKYYSYFGIAPLLTVYFPFYFISGMLPDAGFVMSVFGIMTAVFFALAVEEYAVLSGKKHFGYLPAFCAVSGFLASFALIILRGQARFYYIASMAGMAFSAAFIYFMLKAVGFKKLSGRIIFFALSGISFGLGFLSRVNSVLPLAAVAGVFVILWAIKRIRKKSFPFSSEKRRRSVCPLRRHLQFQWHITKCASAHFSISAQTISLPLPIPRYIPSAPSASCPRFSIISCRISASRIHSRLWALITLHFRITADTFTLTADSEYSLCRLC